VSAAPEVSAAARRRVYPGLDQLVLRSLVVVGTMTAVVAAQAAGADPGPWHQAVLLGLALATAARPESIAGVGMLGGAAYTWSLAPQTLSPLVLLAAAGLVVAHVSALVVAQGPVRMHLDGAQVRLWAWRATLLWVAAAVVWGLAVAMAGLPQHRPTYAVGLGLLIVVAVAATVRISSRPDRPRGR
jgi:hypothetical protein